MEKPIVQVAYSHACNSRRITRSITKAARELQGVVVSRNNQVISKKSKTEKEMPFIPEETIFKIFLLLPAKVLHEVMRTVCRTWRKVIRDPVFIKARLSRSPITTLHVHNSSSKYFKFYFVETSWNLNQRGKGPKKHVINQNYLTHGDGLLLTCNSRDRSILYLKNPLTKQIVTLPRLSVKYPYYSGMFAVACSPSTLECKVAFLHGPSKTTYILTIGVDKEWRKILVESNTTSSMPINKIYHARGIWGVIYWYSSQPNYLIALDVEKEVFYKVPYFPEECQGQNLYHTSSDRFFCFAVQTRSECWEFWEFWELVDYKNGGKWKKLMSVDEKSKRRQSYKIMVCSRYHICPVAFLKRMDVVIFVFDRS